MMHRKKISSLTRGSAALGGLCLAMLLLTSQVQAAGSAIFHLDFDGSFNDISGSAITTTVGSAVSLTPGGGPTLSGGTIPSATFAGNDSLATSGGKIPNEILISGNATFDSLSNSSGSVATWLKTKKDYQWNTIFQSLTFGQTNGIEVSATFGWAGVFGSPSGWGAAGGSSETVDPDFGLVSFPTGSAWSQFDVPVNRADPADGTPTWCCQFGLFGDDANPADPLDPIGKNPVSGVWTHVAYVWDNDTGKSTTYLNGIPGRETQDVTVSGFTPGDWTIGGTRSHLGGDISSHTYFAADTLNPNDLSRTLNGDLADFAVFDGVLTQAEIDQIMADGVSGLGAGLTGDFDSDGDVDGSDFLAWQRNQSVGLLSDWETNFGTAAGVASVAAVPEPTGVALVLLGLGLLVSQRNGRSRRKGGNH